MLVKVDERNQETRDCARKAPSFMRSERRLFYIRIATKGGNHIGAVF